MAKTNPNYTIDTTFSGKDITSAFSVYQFTSSASQLVQFIFKIANASGAGGDYVVHLKRQWGGVGATSIVYGKSTFPVDAGDTDIEFDTMEINVKTGDVVDVMVLGLAGDSSVNGNIRIVSDNPSVLEQSDILSDATPFAGADVDAILVDTGTTLPATLSDMSGATFSTTTDSLEAIRNRGDVSWITGGSSTLTAEDVWVYTNRTLTMTYAEILAMMSGNDISVLRGDTWTIPITGLGSLAGRSKLYFTVRKLKSLGDDDSEIQIEETLNLIYIHGVAIADATPIVATDGVLTVTDEDDGDISVVMKAIATVGSEENQYYYDVQKIDTATGDVDTLRMGFFSVTQDVTRART